MLLLFSIDVETLRYMIFFLSGTDEVLSNTIPINKSHPPAISPAIAVNPVARSDPSSNTGRFSPSQSFRIMPTFAYMVVLITLIAFF
jgi:hypothetical protein